MRYFLIVVILGIRLGYSQSAARMQEQANTMGQAFLKGDYQTFAKYTYPGIVNAMGGESRMAPLLAHACRV